MSHYYNEIDPYCAAWLQNLMDAGQIPHGVIDTRSIEDVRPDELAGFTHCHFFAGLGGWAYALQLAGWGARPVWTGSCPCQPFSAAGKGAGFADERHLWPAWQHLIAQCRPAIIFGEQVASKAVEPWIDLVHADMEGMGYAFGCVPFPSAGVGAPHIRDRTYWVGDADSARLEGHAGNDGAAGRQGSAGSIAEAGVSVRLANTVQSGWSEGRAGAGIGSAAGSGRAGGVVNANVPEPHSGRPSSGEQSLCHGHGESGQGHRAGPTNGFWRDADWISCTDGKWRPVEPGTFPLADGVAGRMGKLRAYGNAINPWQAAEFIRAFAEARGLMLDAARVAA